MKRDQPAGTVYPLFVPPSDIASRTPSEWTESEAKRYFLWLTNSVDDRVAGLLRFLGDDNSSDPSVLLRRVGERAIWVLKKAEFGRIEADGSVKLSDAGYAIAADLGLLVAQRLLDNPGVRWEILRRPKAEASYNQPVLVGLGPVHFDPIRGAVTEALAAVGSGDGGVWDRMYTYWSERARK